MSSKEERMMILQMLKEGKISSEEAYRLLDVLDKNNENFEETNQSKNEGQSKNYKNSHFQEEAEKIGHRINEWKREFKNSFNQNDFEKVIDDFTNKAEKIGKNVANTTFGVLDRVIDSIGSFIDTSSFNIFGSYIPVEKLYNVEAHEGMSLNLEGTNGSIIIKKHNEDAIVIKAIVRSSKEAIDDVLLFINESPNSASVLLKEKGNISVSYEIYVPQITLGKVRINTVNGKIYGEDVSCNEFIADTINSPIDLMKITAKKINTRTKNARIKLGYCIGNEIDINSSNSAIEINHVQTKDITAVTTNGRIIAESIQRIDSINQTNISMQTTNASIKLNMNDTDSTGYYIKAHTSLGSVNLLIPDMVYHHIDNKDVGGNYVEAKSSKFDEADSKVDIDVKSTNGGIEIIK